MMKLRLTALLLLGLMVLALLPTAAQDQAAESALNCLGLSDSDCAFLKQSAENTSKIQSFTHTFTFAASVTNASQIVEGLDTSVSAQGSGTVAIDSSQMTKESPYGGLSLSVDLSGTITDSDGDKSGDTSLVIADSN